MSDIIIIIMIILSIIGDFWIIIVLFLFIFLKICMQLFLIFIHNSLIFNIFLKKSKKMS